MLTVIEIAMRYSATENRNRAGAMLINAESIVYRNLGYHAKIEARELGDHDGFATFTLDIKIVDISDELSEIDHKLIAEVHGALMRYVHTNEVIECSIRREKGVSFRTHGILKRF